MKKAKHPIGVDIGTHSVKVVQMRRAGDQYELEAVGVAELFPNGERPTDAGALRDARIAALKRALEAGQIKAKHAVSAVCGESIIVRYLQLPKMPEEELKKALQWEAEEYIPFRLSEVNIDSMILGQSGDSEHPKMDVLLVSAKKELVEEHVGVIRAAGLEPRIVDVDSFAFLNCFEANYGASAEECVALVNIGGSMTSINIYGQSVTRFSRDITIGGDAITTAIKSRLGCSYAEAERLKCEIGVPVSANSDKTTEINPLLSSLRGSLEGLSGGGDNPQEMAGLAVRTTLNTLLSEVRRSIEFFESQYRGQSVGRVVLGGGSAMIRNLTPLFESELRLPIETIDPLKRLKISNRLRAEQLDSIRHQLGVGIGLGLRGLAA